MVHKNIKKLRTQNEFTQQEMAEAIFCTQNTWSLIENGKSQLLQLDRILLIAQKLGVHPLELFENTPLSVKSYVEARNNRSTIDVPEF